MGDDTSYTWAGMGDARNTDVDWPTEGDVLEYDPSTFGGFGKNVAVMGANLQDDVGGGVNGLRDLGDGSRLSTGGYPEGGTCSDLVSENAEFMQSLLGVLASSFPAAASAALHCRDFYERMDGDLAATAEGVEWAFAGGGTPPPGAPRTGEEYQTYDGVRADGKEKLVEQGSGFGTTWQIYESKDGTVRRVIHTADGMSETIESPSGVVLSSYIAQSDGSSVTKNWNENGTYQGKTVREVSKVTDGNRIHETSTTTTYNENNEQGSSTAKHKVTTEYDDGTESRHSYTEDAEGDSTNEVYVGRQPAAVTQDDYGDLMDKQLGSQELNG